MYSSKNRILFSTVGSFSSIFCAAIIKPYSLLITLSNIFDAILTAIKKLSSLSVSSIQVLLNKSITLSRSVNG